MPTETLAQLLATPQGFKPTIQKLRDMIEYIQLNEAAIFAIDQNPVVWPSASDTYRLVSETSGSAGDYHGVIVGADDSSALYTGILIKLGRVGGVVTNTNTAVLTIVVDADPSKDKVAPIRKISGSSVVDLGAGDMPKVGALLYYDESELAWILINPTTNKHHVSSNLPVPSDGEDGDFWYILE